MATAQDLVSLAASQIGIKESPSGSNMQKYGKAYGVNGVAWCCQFVWWLFFKLGASSLFYGGKKVAYCPYVLTWAKKEGIWLGRNCEPECGDIVLFGKNTTACHIGIVEKRLSASKVQTIEGNTSVTSNDNGGAVMRRTRSYGKEGSSWYVMGFIRPKWQGTKSANKAIATIAQEVIDGKWGDGKKRKSALKLAGYDYAAVQLAVNAALSTSKASSASKTTTKTSKTSTYTITASALNVRTKRSTLSGKIVGTLKRSSKVTLADVAVNKSGNTWGKIASGTYKGRYVCVKFHGSTYAKKA